MKGWRFCLLVLTALGLVLWAGVVRATVIENETTLNQVRQIVNLKGFSATGEINVASLSRVLPDGTEVPFAIPAGHAVLMSRFYFDFKTTSSEPNVNVRLEPFLFPAAGGPIINGAALAAGTFGSGCPIGHPAVGVAPFLIRAVIPGVGTTIPGDLSVAINGILLPSSAPAHLDLLLED